VAADATRLNYLPAFGRLVGGMPFTFLQTCYLELILFSYFHSWFHWLDATVITAAFVVDVLLKGVLEEVGSLVVVLRLWRVFKVTTNNTKNYGMQRRTYNKQIIEELSAGADEQMEPLRERCHELEVENDQLKHEIDQLRKPHSSMPQ
jgi:hypothetical protein